MIIAKTKCPIIGIGCSLGGPKALEVIFREIPKEFLGAFVIVQHIANDFFPEFCQALQKKTCLKVNIARNYSCLSPSEIYIAPPHYHTQITFNGNLILIDSPKIAQSKPSIDVLFYSMSVLRYRSMGVILTGMGNDGAQGLLSLKKSGGVTVAQDEKTSIVFGMPHEAYKNGAVDSCTPLEKIPFKIIQFVKDYNEK